MSGKSFYIETHGCQMNVYDSDFVGEVLERAGYKRAASAADADVILINTCSVRARAERKALSRVAELAAPGRSRPGVTVGVIGCMAQRLGESLARNPRIGLVAGPDTYRGLPRLIEKARSGAAAVDVVQDPGNVYSHHPAAAREVTAIVTIMRGCDNFCSYCVVPYVRGRERSKPHREILGEVEHLVDLGVREVTLTGQNVNSYGDDRVDFARLLEMVNAVPGLARIRFTTSHPKDLSPGVIERIRDLPKVCEHIHLPLQSGSDRILGLMGRNYTAARYREIASLARREVPGVAISTDIMVGFPTETERDHAETLRTMEEVAFESAFMFRYSVREGTRAAGLADDVPTEEKTRRLKEVISLQNRLIDRAKAAMPGERVEILIEGESAREPDHLIGRTRKNWLAKVPRKGVRRGEVIVARITGISRWMIACEEVQDRIGD
jgi:tRNA-2-methylthio-N6-dimethylallyladenosine synthase